MNHYATIRAALEMARDYITSDLASERGAFEGYEGVSRIGEINADLANNDAALSALAELEKAASVPVGSVIGVNMFGHSVIGASLPSGAKLYAAPPAIAAATPVPAVEVSDEMCERAFEQYALSPARISRAEIGRDLIAAVQAELGPALGLVNTSDERERICAAIKATDDAASACDYMLDSEDCIAVVRGELGPSNYVREVMGGGK